MLQHFELQVLLAMLLGSPGKQHGETYSVPLVLTLEKRTGKSVSQAAVFIALRRLEAKGLVASRMEEAESGRTRRYFRLTKHGVAAVKAQRAEHARMWQGLDRVLKTKA